jgi:hypothetical protein
MKLPVILLDNAFRYAIGTCKKNVVFWDLLPCGFCKNGRFGGTYRLHGATSQKTAFFMVTAVKDSHLRNYFKLSARVLNILSILSSHMKTR